MSDPLYTACDSIDADLFLSASEKARQKASLKASGIVTALLAAWTFPHTWGFSKSGATYSITITSVTVRTVIAADGLSRDLLSIAGSATKNGVKLKNADGSPLFPISYYNPPSLIADGTGPVNRNGRLCTYDLVTMAQSLVSDAVGAV